VIFTLITVAAQLFSGITIQEGKTMSISQLIPLAEAGDVRAQVILGDRYFLNEEPALEEVILPGKRGREMDQLNLEIG